MYDNGAVWSLVRQLGAGEGRVSRQSGRIWGGTQSVSADWSLETGAWTELTTASYQSLNTWPASPSPSLAWPHLPTESIDILILPSCFTQF